MHTSPHSPAPVTVEVSPPHVCACGQLTHKIRFSPGQRMPLIAGSPIVLCFYCARILLADALPTPPTTPKQFKCRVREPSPRLLREMLHHPKLSALITRNQFRIRTASAEDLRVRIAH